MSHFAYIIELDDGRAVIRHDGMEIGPYASTGAAEPHRLATDFLLNRGLGMFGAHPVHHDDYLHRVAGTCESCEQDATWDGCPGCRS